MFIVTAVIVIAALSFFMSMSIKTATSLAKIGQSTVMLALIVGGIAAYCLFSAPHPPTSQRQTDSQGEPRSIEDRSRQYERPQPSRAPKTIDDLKQELEPSKKPKPKTFEDLMEELK